MNIIFCFGFMILFGVTNGWKKIVIECPQGWFVQGQIVYYKNSDTGQDFAVCLFCKSNSKSMNNLIDFEICMQNSNFLSTSSPIFSQYSECTETSKEGNSKLLQECSKNEKICGVTVIHGNITLTKALEKLEPQKCKYGNAQHQINSFCSHQSSFVGIKRRTSSGSNPSKSVVCVVCKINSDNSKYVTRCLATLSNFEQNQTFYLGEEDWQQGKVTNQVRKKTTKRATLTIFVKF